MMSIPVMRNKMEVREIGNSKIKDQSSDLAAESDREAELGAAAGKRGADQEVGRGRLWR